ncbi:MAG: hypothetical protein COU47_00015 [Candidatus Niyogibacteria bacterium CG10_big_fil_rev_8_21_14_0_10_46_36]|uniref:Sodium/calcium exchanger membrane region domain-containing protein n=1 Tax=Candidatus Niyogibacteria bacterium CG10_big_fil_rev_8_21_14_0_10_46_36 TaxID=1974726 RepID=A0A2H0TE43_9BACT|nr:MAG: hypothetical protein COU47_00015 [Candidatus Niyogibacteria bacterium CG10_big_fil_rev_8_21_14_0_10_46_36]
MSPVILILIFAVAFITLARSSTFLINAIAALARILRISEYAISFLLMSFATSVSELFVGISSTVGGVSELSLGNIFGANLLNITLVVAVPIFLSGRLTIESKIRRRNFWFIFFLSMFPFLLGFDGSISRGDGLILLLLFVFYIILIAGEREYFSKAYDVNQFHQPSILKRAHRTILLLITGLLFLVVSSAVLVWASTALSVTFAIGTLSFGILFLALATTIPEMTVGIRSAISEHGSMTAGNALGSIAFNSAFIVGLISIIRPISIPNRLEFLSVLGAFIIAFFLFNLFIYRKNNIDKREAVILVLVYLIFIAFELVCTSCLVF